MVRRQNRVDQRAHEGDERNATQKRRHDPFETWREDVGCIEGDPDNPTADDHRHRSEKQRRQRRQEPRAAGRVDRLRIAPDEAARQHAPALIQRHRASDGQSQKQQRSESGVAADLVEDIRECRALRAQLPGNRLDDVFPQRYAEDAVALFEQGSRKTRSPQIADLPHELFGLEEDCAGETLRFVVFGNDRFPLRPVLHCVGTFLRLTLLRFGAQLVEPGFAGFQAGSLFGDQGSDRFDDGIDLEPGCEQVRVGMPAGLKTHLDLRQVRLEAFELCPRGFGFARNDPGGFRLSRRSRGSRSCGVRRRCGRSRLSHGRSRAQHHEGGRQKPPASKWGHLISALSFRLSRYPGVGCRLCESLRRKVAAGERRAQGKAGTD